MSEDGGGDRSEFPVGSGQRAEEMSSIRGKSAKAKVFPRVLACEPRTRSKGNRGVQDSQLTTVDGSGLMSPGDGTHRRRPFRRLDMMTANGQRSIAMKFNDAGFVPISLMDVVWRLKGVPRGTRRVRRIVIVDKQTIGALTVVERVYREVQRIELDGRMDARLMITVYSWIV